MRVRKQSENEIYIDCNDAVVSCGIASWYEVYLVDIDEDRLELSDQSGMAIGYIDYHNCEEDIEVMEHNEDGFMFPEKLQDFLKKVNFGLTEEENHIYKIREQIAKSCKKMDKDSILLVYTGEGIEEIIIETKDDVIGLHNIVDIDCSNDDSLYIMEKGGEISSFKYEDIKKIGIATLTNGLY